MIMSEREKDDKWYEAFADKVHLLGKQWPDPLTPEEYQACEDYADEIVRRPKGEVARPEPPGFTCPRCGHISHSSDDVFEGYCGNCHDWTRS